MKTLPIEAGSMLVLSTCLLVPSPQSTRKVDWPRVSAMQETFLRKLGLPDDVPSQVTDSFGAVGSALLGLIACCSCPAAVCVAGCELLACPLLLAMGSSMLLGCCMEGCMPC